MHANSRVLLAGLFLAVCPCNVFAEDAATAIYQQRVLPLLKAKNPSSCAECHFAGVDLKMYLHKDQATTFAALRAGGLIDVDRPDNSKLLTFINRKPKKENELMAKVREQELEAMRTWIRAAVKDPELLKEKTDIRVGTELSPDVIRHTRKDRVLASFVDNIWSEIGRCVHCHSPEKNERLVKKWGEQMSWIHPNDPAATLAHAVEQGIIDLKHPEKSQIVTKPTGLEDHGGGPKFALGSRTDKNFRRFLVDYAAVMDGKYQTKKELPPPAKEILVGTGQHLRITGVPERFHQKLLRVDIFAKEGDGWSKTRFATADNPIAGKRHLWKSYVMATAPPDSARAKTLANAPEIPAGHYLIKIYIKKKKKKKKDRDFELGENEFYG
ncbi:MAG: hypothetical protein KDA84_22905, partial [Planctomycetaceae bacterium]|nr:hypothetical protein [Planctomycetaceae bacterium]